MRFKAKTVLTRTVFFRKQNTLNLSWIDLLNARVTKQSTNAGVFMKLNSSNTRYTNSGRFPMKPAKRNSALSPKMHRDLAVQVAGIKSGLVREFGTTLGGNGQLLLSALNEAEALAWQTPYPHLLFPVLAEEKASAVNRWAARQRSVRRASRVIMLAE